MKWNNDTDRWLHWAAGQFKCMEEVEMVLCNLHDAAMEEFVSNLKPR
jgi:hypothetical protein